MQVVASEKVRIKYSKRISGLVFMVKLVKLLWSKQRSLIPAVIRRFALTATMQEINT